MMRVTALRPHYLLLLFLINSSTLAFLGQEHHYHIYLWAHYNQNQKNHEIARSCYLILLANQPSPYIYSGFLEHLFYTGLHTALLQLMPFIEKSIQLTWQQKIMVAESLLAAGLAPDGLMLLEKLIKEEKNNPEIVLKISQAYLSNNNPVQALHHIDTYLSCNSKGGSAAIYLFYLSRAQILVMLNKKSAARETILKTIELQPKFEQAWLLLAILDEQEGNTSQAIKNYQQYLNLAGPNPLIKGELERLKFQHEKSVKKP